MPFRTSFTLSLVAVAVAAVCFLPETKATCVTPCSLPDCFCPSLTPPGGIAAKDAPQFVSITFDDKIDNDLIDTIEEFIGYTNPNGCPMRTTFFVSIQYTNFSAATRWASKGHEVADHTFFHLMPTTDPGQTEIEITSNVPAMVAASGIAKSEIVGYRAPFLNYSAANLQTVRKMGLKYDSSMTASNPDGSDRFWPYTLDGGPVNDCGDTPSICGTAAATVPGLWEIPMAAVFDPLGGAHLMDPYIDAPTDMTAVLNWLKTSFTKHYEGGRSPFGIYMHPVQFSDYPGISSKSDYRVMLRAFLAWVRTFENVWFANNKQILAYMQAPVPASQLGNADYMKCMVRSDTTEICNGLDDNGDGIIDNGLQETCQAGTTAYSSCYGCPSAQPSPANPAPSSTSRRCPVAAGCHISMWDPIGCACSTSALKDLGAANLAAGVTKVGTVPASATTSMTSTSANPFANQFGTSSSGITSFPSFSSNEFSTRVLVSVILAMVLLRVGTAYVD